MAPMYYRCAKAAILVFDVSDEESFHRVTQWLRDLKAHADPDVVICLAGNKCDLQCTFDLSICEEYASSIGGTFVLTSAVTGEGVDTIFNNIAKGIIQNIKRNKHTVKDTDIIDINSKKNKKPSSCC